MEQLEAKKQKVQARAKLRVYQEIKEFTDELHSVEDDPLDTSPIPINLETEATSLHQPQERRHSATDRKVKPPILSQWSVASKISPTCAGSQESAVMTSVIYSNNKYGGESKQPGGKCHA